MKKLLLSVCMCVAMLTANAQFVKNDFTAGLNVGDNIEKGAYSATTQGDSNPIMADQWNRTGKTGDANQGGVSPAAVAPLSYTNYIESNLSNAIQLTRFEKVGEVSPSRFTIYSLTNGNDYIAGTYYIAMMVKVEEVASSTGADFFMLDGNYTANNQRAKIFVKNAPSSDAAKFAFGLADDTSSPAVSSGEYDKDQTFLLVLKYNFDLKGQAGNTGIELFINPDPKATEPAATIATEVKSTSLSVLRGLTLRQRTTSKLQIGGIRFSDTWAGALGLEMTSIENNVVDKGNVISTKYYDLRGLEVNEPVNTKSIYIKKDVYEDGSVEVLKVMR